MFVNVEDYETTVCDGRRIGHCLAIGEFEYAEPLVSGQETTFCLVVWNTADSRVDLPVSERWVMGWVPMAFCHPVEAGFCCCVRERESLRRSVKPDAGQQGETSMSIITVPEVVVEKDYDGYFENLVRSWVGEKAMSGVPFRHARLVVSAGPWRPYAVDTFERDDGFHLDFYAALRVGFGALSDKDVEAVKELL